MKDLSHFKRLFLLLIAVAVLVMPYTLNTWWKFFPAIVAIVVITNRISKSGATDLGLKFNKKTAMVGMLVFVAAITVATLVVSTISRQHGIIVKNDYGNWNLGWKLMPLSQAFAEELVLRALMLNYFTSFLYNKKFVALLSATIFMLWHLIFFPYAQGVWLSLPTLATLFLFGYATSNFFLITGSIALSLGLHAGWNLIKFSSDYYLDGNLLKEAEVFNLIEGSWVVVLIAFATAIVSQIYMRRSHGTN